LPGRRFGKAKSAERGHPNPIRCIDFELPIQCVVGDNSRLAAITTRAAFVADLRRYARQAGQPRNTVLRTDLTLIEEIIV
jgi:hypothetical protein